MTNNFKNEVAQFKKWAKNNEHTSAEWEFYYEHWHNFLEAAKEVMQRCATVLSIFSQTIFPLQLT